MCMRETMFDLVLNLLFKRSEIQSAVIVRFNPFSGSLYPANETLHPDF